MTISKETVLEMHSLGKRKENTEEYLIGRTDVSDFVILPNIAIEVIELFEKGLSINQVEEILKQKNMDVDVMDFATTLINDLHFVYKVNGKIINEVVEDPGHFHWIPQKVGKWFFNKYTIFLYILISLLGFIICLFNMSLIPNYNDAFVFSSVTYSLLLATFTGWLLVFMHEFSHLLAAKSLGVKSKIGFGHRLVFPVVETDMSNIVLLPHNKRYRALFAGMAWDGVLFGLGVLILQLATMDMITLNNLSINIIRLINLNCILGIAFQFLLYLETDIYYIFTTYFKCNNLLHNTRLLIRIITGRGTIEQKEELRNIETNERKIMHWYVWIYIIGVVWALSIFIAVTFPTFIKFTSITIMKLANHPIYSNEFFDGFIFIILSSVPFLILFRSWYITWRSNTRRKRITTPIEDN